MTQGIIWAAYGTTFTFLMTAAGSAFVFFFRRQISELLQKVLLGFAAGVMIAASVWCLLQHAIERVESSGAFGWIILTAGFLLGVAFLIYFDSRLGHLHSPEKKNRGLLFSGKRPTLLFTAITLHNIPEGMAIGLAFALAAQSGGDPALFTSAVALCLSIGIHDVPEGAIISFLLRQEGIPASRSFFYGSLTGIVQPLFGTLVAFLVGSMQALMPWMLSFAAGAMLYVVMAELIPETQKNERSRAGTLGVLGGFLLMTVLHMVSHVD